MSILLAVGIVILIFVSVVMGLLILMQRTKDGGIGAALGGGMAESAFGAETNTILSKTTIKFAIIFFVLGFLLYLGYVYQYHHGKSGDAAPEIAVPIMAPAAPAQTPAPASLPAQ